jgi:hypothetical protein
MRSNFTSINGKKALLEGERQYAPCSPVEPVDYVVNYDNIHVCDGGHRDWVVRIGRTVVGSIQGR